MWKDMAQPKQINLLQYSDLICIIISLLLKIFIISHGMICIQLIGIHWFFLETPQIFI